MQIVAAGESAALRSRPIESILDSKIFENIIENREYVEVAAAAVGGIDLIADRYVRNT
jgi:hypothetical protein